jgi:RHS repeat-associated protein
MGNNYFSRMRNSFSLKVLFGAVLSNLLFWGQPLQSMILNNIDTFSYYGTQSDNRETVEESDKDAVNPLPTTRDATAPLHGHEPASDSYLYSAKQISGTIGTSSAEDIDDGYDNFFTVTLPEDFNPNAYEAVMSYDLFGVADASQTTKSINNAPAYGGKAITLNDTWTLVEERLPNTQLKAGENQVYFNRRAQEQYQYKVRNLTIALKPTHTEEKGISINMIQNIGGNLFISGITNNPHVSSIEVLGQEVSLSRGVFEAVINNVSENIKNTRVSFYSNGKQQSTNIAVHHNTDAVTYTFKDSKLYEQDATYHIEDFKNASAQYAGLCADVTSTLVAIPGIALQVQGLKFKDIKILNHDLENVTYGDYGGYRVKKIKMADSVAVQLRLKFDPALIPDGYTAKDIKTYYFDASQRDWKALPVDSLDENNNEIVTTIYNNDTDYLTGVIKVPDSPETGSYTPTTISEMKFADPASGIVSIQPPTASSTGTASTSFPLKLPAGRGGMQPSLQVSYNSEAGNGWMGIGWNLSTSSITINTKWGAPLYSTTNETEIYALDGSDLVLKEGSTYTNPHRQANIAKMSERIFYQRKEGGYNKIIRHGSSPTNYFWEVIDKGGTRTFYGGITSLDNAAVLKNASGNIGHWAIKRVQDAYGNYIDYEYSKTTTTVAGTSVAAQQFYLSKIQYTRNTNGLANYYEVRLNRNTYTVGTAGSTSRTDVVLSGKNGYFEVVKDLLTEASVWLITNSTQQELIRTYRFDYEEKDFKKQQLVRISEYDANNQLFYSNTMEYYTLQNQNNNQNILGTTPATWTGSNDSFQTTLPSIPGISPNGSPLGTSSATGVSFGFRGGFGLGLAVWNIGASAGGSFNYSTNNQLTRISILDINGDGLPDKLIDGGSSIYYRPNTGTGFGNPTPLSGISELSKTKSRTVGGGFDATFGPLSVGKSWSKTKSDTDSYFSDFNGDGLVDLVTGGRVKFNVGGNSFVNNASTTPNPIISGSISSSVLPSLKLETLNELREQNPQYDHIKVWEAPMNGTIRIVGTAKVISNVPDAQGHSNSFRFSAWKANAGQVAGNASLVMFDTNVPYRTLSAANSTITTNVNTLVVNKGDRLLFRIHNLDYGYGGKLEWDPNITYLSGTPIAEANQNGQVIFTDDNNKYVNYFNAKQDFILNNDEGTAIKDGTTSIIFNFNMQQYGALAFSDDLRFNIKLYSVNSTTGALIPYNTGWYVDYKHATGIFTHNLPAAPTSPFTISGLNTNTKYSVVVYVESTSNVRWDDIKWQPTIKSNVADLQYPSVNYYNYNENINQSRYWFYATQLPEPVISTTIPSDANQSFVIIDHDLFNQGNYASLIENASSAPLRVNWVVKEKTGTSIAKVIVSKSIYVRKNSSGTVYFSKDYNGTQPINLTTDLDYQKVVLTKLRVKNLRAANTTIFASFYINNREVANDAKININLAPNQSGYAFQAFNIAKPFFSKTPDVFGVNYRGWNQFLYNGGIKLQHNEDGDVIPNSSVTVYGTLPVDLSIFDYESQSDQAQMYDENTPAEDLPSNDSAPRYATYNYANQNNSYLNTSIIGSAYSKAADGQITAFVGRFGEANLYDVYVDPATIILGGSTVFSGLKQRSESKGSSLSASASYANGTESKATSNVLNQYMDLNGDSYPDLVTGGIIQYTNMLGGLSSKQIGNDFNSGDESKDQTVGVTIPSIAPNSTNASNGKATGNKTNTNISAGVNQSSGESFNSNQWADVNGDGLADKVRLQGNTIFVWLNTGYGFTEQIAWFTGSTEYKSSNRSNSSVGATFGFSNSFAIGLGAATSTANMQTMLVDINGDGLPELVVNDGGTYKYHLNRGDRFDPAAVTFFTGAIDQDVSTSANIFATFTFGIPIPLLLVNLKVVFTPSAGVNNTLSQKTATLQDMNGDGFIDVVAKASTSNNSNISARLSQINKTYLLKKVNTALGGSWTVEYSRAGNTYDLPQNKWTVTLISTHDGFTGDTSLRPDATATSITYANPKHDRREREFLGFGTVTVKQLNPSGMSVFRTVVNTYHTENYYLSGLLKSTATYNSGNQILSEQKTLYNLLDPDAPQVNIFASNNYLQANLISNGATLLDKSRLFVGMARSTSISYENGSSLTSIKDVQSYDVNGNITAYMEQGNPESYKAVIEYEQASAFAVQNMTGFPKTISIYLGETSTLLRRRSATYNVNGKMTQIVTKLNQTEDNTVSFEYDNYGNMNKVTEHDNKNSANSNSYVKNISYDTTVYTYPTGITNSFGETSSTQYNYLFGVPVFSIDKNAQSMRTRIDDRGRVVEFTGPNELALETSAAKAWTIRMQYKGEQALATNLDGAVFTVNASGQFAAVTPGAANPTNAQHYAVTRHFDPEFATPNTPTTSNEMVTISIVDGFGQAVQVKKTHKTDSTMKWLVSGFDQKDAFGRTLRTYLPAVQTPYPTTLGTYSTTDTGYYNATVLQPPVEMTYDDKDRVVTVKQPGETQVAQMSYTIENNLMVQKLINELSQTMDTYTDNRGRQRKTIQNGEITTVFDYNAVNELIKVTDNEGAVTAYKYDMAGRKTEMQHPDRGVILFKYDKAGRMIQQSNSNLQLAGGQMINYSYDYSRLTRVAYPQNPQNEVKYTYGAASDQMAITENAVGRLLYQEDASGVQVFGYGRMGEVTKNLRSVAVAGYSSYWFYTSWTYDSWNRVQEIVYPDEERVMYSYNKAGMLESIKSQISGITGVQDVVSLITYNDLGERKTLKHGNGVTTYYSYDTRRRLSTIAHGFTGMDISKQYGYDALSNILSIETLDPQSSLPDSGEIGGPVNHFYTYDNYNRLETAQGNYTGASDQTNPYLQQGYNLKMEYNPDHTIKRKTQVHTQGLTSSYGGNLSVEVPVLKTNYDLQYSDYATGAFVAGPSSYGYQQPHAVRTIIEAPAGDSNLVPDDPRIKHKKILYDANGNQKEIKEKVGELEISLRKNLWDEENRLIGVDLKPDQVQIHPISVYTYNAGGERTVRYNMDRMDANSNATRVGAESRDNIMIYPSGLLMGKVIHTIEKGRNVNRMTYTKHYYIGSERISAKTGTSPQMGLYPSKILEGMLPQLNVTTIRNASTASVTEAKALVTKVYNAFTQQPPVMNATVEDTWASSFSHESQRLNLYYFHPDHLGSSSYITNATGRVSQHMEYLPFGETLVDEHINSFSSPFKFNGKEYDEETGNYYYSARYYDPKFSIFTSVDPLAEETGDAYGYCANNPIIYIDPDGKKIIGVTKQDAQNFKADIHLVLADKKFDQLRSLIDVSGTTFNKIDSKSLGKALEGVNLTADEKAYVSMVTNTINSKEKHKVEYLTGAFTSSEGATAYKDHMNNSQAGVGDAMVPNGQLSSSLITGLGGEGLNVPTTDGSHSFITSTPQGNERATVSGHEVFGHGLPAAKKMSPMDNNANAIRTDNLIRRILNMPQRDGKNHGGFTQGHITKPQELPITQ